MAEGNSDPSFSWLVLKRAWFGALGFFESWQRDLVAFFFSFGIGEAIFYRTHGWPATWSDGMDNLIHLVTPVVVLWVLLFVWHLWLAPAALAYEAARQSVTHPKSKKFSDNIGTTPPKPEVNWAIWKQRSNYRLTELASILAKIDPNGNDTPESEGFLDLLKEDAMARRLPCRPNRLAESRYQPDLYPASFDVQKTDALKWAAEKGFDLSHVI
jgi:hypothetical protein